MASKKKRKAKRAAPKKAPKKKARRASPERTAVESTRAEKARKEKARKARALRVKPRKGPLQIALPLQMPLALGVEAFAERAVPVVDAPPNPADAKPSEPVGEQETLFE
jgi:hypothetical protein